MAAAGAIVGAALVAVRDAAKPGVSTLELDRVAESVIRDAGAVPSFLGYHGFSGSICSSVNNRVVHGIPSADDILVEGDLVSIDCGAILDGWHGDSAWTFGVGELSEADAQLSEATRLSMEAGIAAMVEGNRLPDVSHAIELGTQPRRSCTAGPTGSSTATGGTRSAARCTWIRSCRTRERPVRVRTSSSGRFSRSSRCSRSARTRPGARRRLDRGDHGRQPRRALGAHGRGDRDGPRILTLRPGDN